MEYNQRFKSTDRRQNFLKDLANQICMSAMEIRTLLTKSSRISVYRNSMEMVLELPIQLSLSSFSSGCS